MSGPHDLLFKALFSGPEHAAGLLRDNLPQSLAARIDWTALELVPGSFVTPDLAEHHTDLLYRVPFAEKPALLYLLFEHQSTVDPWMPFRLLEYIVRIWSHYRKEQPDAIALPPVVPIVLHHSPTGWRASTELTTLLDAAPEDLELLRPYVPAFRFVLDDLSHLGDDELRARAACTLVAKCALFCLKSSRAEEIMDVLPKWQDVWLSILHAPNGLDALKALLSYTVHVSHLPTDECWIRLRSLLETSEENDTVLLTVAEQLEQKGRVEGRVQGEAIGMAKVLERLLARRFGALGADIKARIESATTDTLELWAERVLTAKSIDEVFAP